MGVSCRSLLGDQTMGPGGIIVCRFDSQRLPGKVLREVCGRPLLAYILDRCRKTVDPGGRLVVATTNRPTDDPIASYCTENGYEIYRGDPDNVAGRVLACARTLGLEWFFRLNGDSPFVEANLLSQGWKAACTGEYDLVTNLCPRSYPYGVSVELIRTVAFERAYRQMRDPEDFEHVTRFLYRNIEQFRYYNLMREGRDLSALRLTVDTPEDLAMFAKAVSILGDRWSAATYLDAAAVYAGERQALALS
jgi:spore coat polysaccharide biosynthesis protein SpsF